MAGRWRDGIQADTRANQPAATAVAVGTLYFVTDEGELERSTGSAWVQVGLNETGHDALDHTGLTGVGGGSSLGGRSLLVPVLNMNMGSTATANLQSAVAYAWPVAVAGPMQLDKLGMHVTTGNAGTVEWGLFDCSSDPTACTKVAGGSGALSSTGYQTIAATGAPVSLSAGAYVLIVRAPTSGGPVIRRSDLGITMPSMKFQVSYTWDDTPNIESGWTTDSVVVHAWLHGRTDAGSTW